MWLFVVVTVSKIVNISDTKRNIQENRFVEDKLLWCDMFAKFNVPNR
jgi:hypothetical protein